MENFSETLLGEFSELREFMQEKIGDTALDSAIFVSEKKRILKFFKELEIYEKLRLTSRNRAIQEWSQKKFGSEKDITNLSGSVREPFRIRYINLKRGNKSLTNAIILIENSIELNNLCKERKKKYGTYAMVVFAGLYQPTREIKPLTHKILRSFLKRFNLWAVDLAKDFVSSESINSAGKEKFKEAVSKVSLDDKKVFCEKSTIYANFCKEPIKKVLIYDKYLKESVYHKQGLKEPLREWKRVEMRLSIKKRFSKLEKSFFEPFNELLDDIAREYNWVILFGTKTEALDAQLSYFRDGRRRIKRGVKFKEWVA